jgi:hypothetical protein
MGDGIIVSFSYSFLFLAWVTDSHVNPGFSLTQKSLKSHAKPPSLESIVAFSSPSFGAAPVPVALAAFSGGPPTSVADGPESGIENRVDSQKERAANFRRVYIFVLYSEILCSGGGGGRVRLLVWCHNGQRVFS